MLRSEYPKNVLLRHLNISSVRNEFKKANELIRINFDIFIITESKVDSSFSDSQFHIPGLRLFRKDRNKNGGGVMYYISQNLPVKEVTSYKFPSNLKVLPREITPSKRKILLLLLCRPHLILRMASNCIWKMSLYYYKSLHYITTYENITLIRDFNMNLKKNKFLNYFTEIFNLKNLINEPTDCL